MAIPKANVTMPYDHKVKGLSLDNGGAGGASSLAQLNDVQITDPQNGNALVYDATSEKWVNGNVAGGGEHEWISIFKDSTLLPLDSITVTASGGRATLTDVFYAPLPSKTADTVIVQSVKVIIDDVELITKAILAMGSLVIMNDAGNQPLIMFQPATTGITAMAVLQDGEHEISCYIDNITNECYYKSNQGAGTAADPYSLYDARIGDLVDVSTLMAIVSQCRPITIIGDEPLNAETATGFNYSYTGATTYDITVYAGINYYGLKAGGSD